MQSDLYRKAQTAIAELKSATFELLERGEIAKTNAEIGRSLGIYMGHIGHEGHISRTILSLMEDEGSVIQDGKGGKWYANLGGSVTPKNFH
jgi:hypothetical protein